MTHPSVNSIVERLRRLSQTRKAFREGIIRQDVEIVPTLLDEAATIISELQAELQDAKTVIAQLNERSAQYERSTYAAESSLARIKEETIEAVKEVIEPWTNPGTARQRAGEMTAQEVRTLQAVLSSILDAIRSLDKNCSGKTAESGHSGSTQNSRTE